MRRQLRAELVEITTTGAPRALVGAALLAAAALAAVALAARSPADLRSQGALGDALTLAAAGAAPFALALGVLALAGRQPHGTLDAAVVAADSRRQVIAARLVVRSIAAALAGLLAAAVAVAVTAPWMARDPGWDALGAAGAQVALANAAAAGLLGAAGVGLGALAARPLPALALGAPPLAALALGPGRALLALAALAALALALGTRAFTRRDLVA